MNKQFRKMLFGCIALSIMLFAGNSFAQEFRGTITGTVSDPNGSVLPGAVVTIKNLGTNIETTVTTNSSGSFTVPMLDPGSYSIKIVADGFKTSTRESVTVAVSDRLTFDFALEIGTSAEVNIIADSEVLERGSVTLGTAVSQRQIEELPLAEGAPYTLATQAPGVVYTGDPNFQGPTANGNLAGFRSNGTAGNQINLDGSPNPASDGQVGFTPPSDSVREFRVQTNAFDAQDGFTSGSTVNVAIKSGGNRLHGSANFFDRDRSRTANNFFNNRAGRERPGRKYNRYGFVLNGPVYVPGLYDGKDKTFFLFSFERQKDNVAQPTTYSVPTMAMRNGDFSALPYTIYNPFTGALQNSTCAAGSTGTTVCRQPFAGNIIPQGLIYGPAQALLNLYPEPNLPGNTNNYITDQNLLRPYKSYMVKIDHQFNSNHKITGKWYHSRNTEDRYNWTGEPDSIFRGFENRRNNGGNVNYTATLSQNWIFDLRGSLTQFRLRRFQEGQPTAGELGFTGIPADRQGAVFPRFDFQNYTTIGSLRADYNDGRDRPFEVFTVQPTVTFLSGNHTFKFGYDYRQLHETFESGGYAAGRFTVGGLYTAQASNSSATLRNNPGMEIASFLLGIAQSGSNSLIDNPQRYDVTSNYQGFFVHDDWRITPKLTLNLGLRYELETGYKEADGRMIRGFDQEIASPLQAGALANYNANVPTGVPVSTFQNLTGGLIFANGNERNQAADKNNFQPRIGLSYAIDNKTVVRGGFGIFTAPFQIQTTNVLFQPGFSTPTLYTPTTNNGLTFTATLQNPFPNGISADPGSARGLLTFVGRDLTSSNLQGPTTNVLQYDRNNANFARFVIGLQRELPGGIGMEATYINSRGYNIGVSRELNSIPREFLNDLAGVTDRATITAAIAAVNTNLNATVPNPFRGLIPDGGTWNANTIQRRRLLTAFPQYGNVSIRESNGKSSYQSFQVQFVKRFTQGLSLNGSYTFSRERESTRYLNPQDSELTEFISPTERPNRFTFSGIYELPIGKGKALGKDWHPVVDAFLGGWQFQGVYEWQSGEPLLFGNVFYNGDPTKIKSRIGKKNEQGQRYGIDIPAWELEGFYLDGIVATANAPGFANNFTSSSSNTLRYFPITLDNLRHQRFLKFDMGMSKNFRIREGMKLQVRIEAINFLNRPYFTIPNTDPANSGFGRTTSQRQPPRDIQIGGRFTF